MWKFTVAALALWGLLSAPVALWAEGEKGTPRLGTGASADWLGGHAEDELFRDAGKAGATRTTEGAAALTGAAGAAASGGIDDGADVRLTTIGDNVGIGTATP